MVKNNVYRIKKAHIEQITELIDNKRPFEDVQDFIDRALEVYLTWEKSPESTMNLFKNFPFTPEQETFMSQSMKQNVIETQYPEVANKMESIRKQRMLRDEKNLEVIRKDYKEILMWLDSNFSEKKHFSKCHTKNELLISYDGFPLIYRFYSRVLPVKIAIITLANIMKQTEKLEVELEDFADKAYDIAEELSEEIREFEDQYGKKRNERISTGFPQRDEDADETYITRKRFKEQYIGNKRTSIVDEKEIKSFDGALSALGLIQVYTRGKNTFITLTDLGKEFCMIESPVITDKDYSKAFSEEEGKFIVEKIFLQRELECTLIEKALDAIKNNPNDIDITTKLDKIFRDEIEEYVKKKKPFYNKLKLFPNEHDTIVNKNQNKQSRIMAFRVATMGRLAETGKIKWDIAEKGKSKFSLIIQKTKK